MSKIPEKPLAKKRLWAIVAGIAVQPIPMAPAVLAAFSLICLSGCATVSDEEIGHANYGPFPTDYKHQVVQAVEASPGATPAAEYVFSKPIQGVSHSLFTGGGKAFGYIVPVEVIHTARAEARTPDRLRFFMISDGRVTEVTARFVDNRARYTGGLTD